MLGGTRNESGWAFMVMVGWAMVVLATVLVAGSAVAMPPPADPSPGRVVSRPTLGHKLTGFTDGVVDAAAGMVKGTVSGKRWCSPVPLVPVAG